MPYASSSWALENVTEVGAAETDGNGYMYADRKYTCSKLADIKIGGGGPMATGNGRGDGLIGIIRPERNDDVIVTDGPSSRALSMRAFK